MNRAWNNIPEYRKGEAEINKEFAIPMGPAKRDPGSGRPTKSERRAIERLMGWLKGR